MPIHVHFDGPILRVDVLGKIVLAELGEAVTRIASLESSVPVAPHRITDMTGNTGMEARFPDVLQIANWRKSRTYPNNFKSAIVAPRPADVGVARMFQTLGEHPQVTVEIFSDFASAYAWVMT